ncbi:hypothetical protein CF326_g9345, partial [Tilletia indica]
LKPFEQAEHYTAAQLKQWKRAAKLNTDRPIICIQLERYEEGIADLERSRTFFDGPGKFCFGEVEELAVQACCFWLLGQSEEALKILKSALQLVHDDVDRDAYQEYGLALGWQGAIKSAVGDHIYALKDGEHAVKVLRNRLSSTETRLSAQFELDPFERMLPHHLVLLAGTQLAVGLKEEAMGHVEESLKLNSDIRVDGSTVKTALLLKARLLEEKTSISRQVTETVLRRRYRFAIYRGTYGNGLESSSSTRHCGEDALLSKLGVGLFEQLGEEFPEALACRLSAISGCIAKAIGPQDVLQVLLTNLRVQERQRRVCSTVAIAMVAETCSPFTTIPHILQEYRTPELDVRNGCLKALSFLIEYIGEMGKDYVNSVVTLLEDALMDRDHVHRQTAAA